MVVKQPASGIGRLDLSKKITDLNWGVLGYRETESQGIEGLSLREYRETHVDKIRAWERV